jgi:hypothetical protein
MDVNPDLERASDPGGDDGAGRGGLGRGPRRGGGEPTAKGEVAAARGLDQRPPDGVHQAVADEEVPEAVGALVPDTDYRVSGRFTEVVPRVFRVSPEGNALYSGHGGAGRPALARIIREAFRE